MRRLDTTNGAGAEPTSPGPSTGLLVVLAGLCLLLAALLGRVLWLQHQDADQVADAVRVPQGQHLDDGSAADQDIEHAVIAGEGAKRAGLSAAAAATRTVLSYSHDSLDDDIAAARAVLSPEQRRDYDETMARLREQTEKNEITVVATVASSSVVSATAHDVKALLFVNQETSGPGLRESRLDQDRVLVSLHRDSGGWQVTALTAV